MNEYFRKNFRKFNTVDGLNFVTAINPEHFSSSLDKFWIWHTIEESIRGEVATMSQSDFDATFKVFSANFRGSPEFRDLMETRLL